MHILAHTLIFTRYHIHSYSHTHTDSISHLTPTFSHIQHMILFQIFSHMLSQPPSHAVHIISHAHPFIRAFSNIFILPLTHTPRYTLSHTYILLYTLTHTHNSVLHSSHTHSHTLTCMHSFTHTHTFHTCLLTDSQTHSHTHTLTRTVFLSLSSHLRVPSICKFRDSTAFQFNVTFPITFWNKLDCPKWRP